MSRQELITAAKAPSEAYGEKDWDAVRNALAPEFVYDEVATYRKAEGIDEVIDLWRGWAKALPDSRATFEDPFVDGDTVVLPLTWRGTHTGPLPLPDGEIPPTGKRIALRSCQVIRIRGGKAISMRQYFDMLTLLSQLGVAPAETAEAAKR
ncbi:MAG: ester cyclase [Gemmatimonadota bacterium]